jgi:hypothetical protein
MIIEKAKSFYVENNLQVHILWVKAMKITWKTLNQYRYWLIIWNIWQSGTCPVL